MDASRVDYVDHNPARLAMAATLGANPIEMPRHGRDAWYRRHAPRRGGVYPIAVDAASNAEALRFALRSLAPGGVCTSVGMLFQRHTSIPLMQMYANDSTLRTGISHPRADLPAVLELIRGGRFHPQKITTVLADWRDAAEAWLERTTKVVVHRPALYAG
jgi:alcohol dehydrogenase